MKNGTMALKATAAPKLAQEMRDEAKRLREWADLIELAAATLAPKVGK